MCRACSGAQVTWPPLLTRTDGIADKPGLLTNLLDGQGKLLLFSGYASKLSPLVSAGVILLEHVAILCSGRW